MFFEPQTLAPGPGIGVQAMATFRWRSFQSARGRVSSTLSGSGVFHASTSGGGHDGTTECGFRILAFSIRIPQSTIRTFGPPTPLIFPFSIF